MPTILDTLLIKVGLDASAVKKSRVEAADAAAKGYEQTAKSAKSAEHATTNVAASFSKAAREALMFFATLASARAIANFVRDLSTADAAVGRLAASIGRAPDEFAAFGLAVEKAGGSAQAAMGGFRGFIDSLVELNLTGTTQTLPWFARLEGLTNKHIDITAKAETQLLQLADSLAELAKTDPATASSIGRHILPDADTINFLMQGSEKVREAWEAARKYAPSEKDVAAGQALSSSIVSVGQAVTSLWRSVATQLTPQVVELLKKFEAWIEENREWIKTGIVDAIKQFVDEMSKVPWKKIGDGLGIILSGIAQMTEAMGGFVRTTEILFGLWLGGKALAVINAVRVMLGLPLLAGLGAGLAGAGVGVAAAGAYLLAENYRDTPEHRARLKAAMRRHQQQGNPGGPFGSLPDRDLFEKSGYSGDFYDAIMNAEGTNKPGKNPYDVSLGNVASPKPLSQMTMGESLAWGDHIRKNTPLGARTNSSAKGAFQITNSTQRDAMAALGLSDDDMFNEENQRRLADWIARNQGLGAWSGFNLHPGERARAEEAMRQRRSSIWAGDKNVANLAPEPGLAAARQFANRSPAAVSNSSETSIGAVTIVTTSKEAGGGPRDLNPLLQRANRAGQANFGLA